MDISSATSTATLFSSVVARAKEASGMALLNLLDVNRKTELLNSNPLAHFGIGSMLDTYA